MASPIHYSFIVATRLEDGLTFDEVMRRFVEVNRCLRRLEIVRMLCVLGEGTIQWVFQDEAGEFRPPLFMGDDLYENLSIGFEPGGDSGCAIYSFARSLLLHLYHSVLAAEDIAAKYGPAESRIQVANAEDLTHNAFARTVNSASVPWDLEWSPFSSLVVNRGLGAHVADDDGE